MEKKIFVEKAEKIKSMLDGRVIVDQTKEEVMEFFGRYMGEVEHDSEYTGEQVAELSRILLRCISHPACESDREREEKRAMWRRERFK